MADTAARQVRKNRIRVPLSTRIPSQRVFRPHVRRGNMQPEYYPGDSITRYKPFCETNILYHKFSQKSRFRYDQFVDKKARFDIIVLRQASVDVTCYRKETTVIGVTPEPVAVVFQMAASRIPLPAKAGKLPPSGNAYFFFSRVMSNPTPPRVSDWPAAPLTDDFICLACGWHSYRLRLPIARFALTLPFRHVRIRGPPRYSPSSTGAGFLF